MSIFDILGGNKENTVVFEAIPASLDEFKALPQAALSTPYDTAALTVLAFTVYPSDRDAALAMLDYLRGPRPMSPMDKQFIRDRFMDSDYVPRSYFAGATPANDYTPDTPYKITMKEGPKPATEGMVKILVTSGGADSPRQIELRLAKDGRWYLWEQYILSGIRMPESSNPWA